MLKRFLGRRPPRPGEIAFSDLIDLGLTGLGVLRNGRDEALALRGKAAVANARLAYERFEHVFADERFAALAEHGAHPQRPLWASTGVKNEDYPDTLYVSELVTSGTVNTMPSKTMDAFADHGEVKGDTVRNAYSDAHDVMAQLEKVGIDYDDVIAALEKEGVDKFIKSWDELKETVEGQMDKSR